MRYEEIEGRKRIKLKKFVSILEEWNKIHNLSGAKTTSAIWENIIDSIYPCRFIDTPNSLLDVGTGAGFPGLILGIIYSESKVVLTEPRNKRASFLRFILLELGLENIEVERKRVEEYRSDKPFDLITSRAVTDTKILLRLTEHLRDRDTEYLFYKGEKVFEEIKSVGFDEMNYKIMRRGRRNYLFLSN